MFFGLFLVILGILVLLRTLGIISGSLWGYFWAVILISLGASIIWGRRRWMRWHEHWWHEHNDLTRR